MKNRFKPAAPELLLRGFQAIDVENKGYLTPDYLKNLLTTQGEVLSEVIHAFATVTKNVHPCFFTKKYGCNGFVITQTI